MAPAIFANFVSGTFDIGLALPTALTVASPVASAVNPIVQGSTVILTAGTVVDNVGNGTYTYQWQTDGGSGNTPTNIPGATFPTFTNNTTGSSLGNFQYQLVVKDSTLQTITSPTLIVDVVQQEAGTLTTGSAAPVPGSSDVFQLDEATSATRNSGGLNYYTDNGINNGGYMGNTFTTGSNAKGYAVNSQPAIDLAGGNVGGLGATNITYSLYLYKISADGTTAQTIAVITNYNAGSLISAYPTWVAMSFAPINLTSNTMYGYGFGRGGTGSQGSVYFGLATSGTQDWYPGGQLASFPAGGGTVTYGNNASLDGTFDVGLVPLGVPILLSAISITPSPPYALSPVELTCRPTGQGFSPING